MFQIRLTYPLRVTDFQHFLPLVPITIGILRFHFPFAIPDFSNMDSFETNPEVKDFEFLIQEDKRNWRVNDISTSLP